MVCKGRVCMCAQRSTPLHANGGNDGIKNPTGCGCHRSSSSSGCCCSRLPAAAAGHGRVPEVAASKRAVVVAAGRLSKEGRGGKGLLLWVCRYPCVCARCCHAVTGDRRATAAPRGLRLRQAQGGQMQGPPRCCRLRCKSLLQRRRRCPCLAHSSVHHPLVLLQPAGKGCRLLWVLGPRRGQCQLKSQPWGGETACSLLGAATQGCSTASPNGGCRC